MPRKQVPRAQAIFVAQAGRKFRLFFFDNAKVRKIQITSNFFSQKSTQKSTQPEKVDNYRYTVTVVLSPPSPIQK